MKDAPSIIITFVVGFMAGGYLYLTNFAPLANELTAPDLEDISELSIVSEVYGGCRDACPSFQVVKDGSYRYLFTPAAGQEQIIREGTLPFQLRRELNVEITPAVLKVQSRPIQPSICNSYTDGIDIKYEITLDGVEYVIDSCGTAVDGESDLWQTLSDVWNYYETSGG